MTEHSEFRAWSAFPWRIVGWGLAVLLLLLPLLAMQFTDEVNWNVFDFAFAATLIFSIGIAFEFAIRKSNDVLYRAAAGVALAATFLLVWISASVGIIGADGEPANLMYLGVPVLGIVGAVIARLRARGMARTLFAMATAQAVVAALALFSGFAYSLQATAKLVVLNGFFISMFVVAALLFRKASARQSAVD